MHPMLVLGSIVITVSAAAFTVAQVPGWITNSQDSTAVATLDRISALQEDQLSGGSRTFINGKDLAAYAKSLGAPIKGSGVTGCVAKSTAGTGWVAVVRSASGSYFARTSESTKDGKGRIADEAIIDVGSMPASLKNPYTGNACTYTGYSITA
ncbi:hypothetical protein [Microbacterium sp. 77mftsu3.1]|uniref:hypothetical protein n=1 Tax=Microbacterium sp. 77mftsu3.1 TaxID=1761802 RepID=UPI000381B31A|nr:hypothetical protein [Microbacterium sp. 77mftsu3.1]SDH51197.1 hypothetical protein SAMN04488590_3487 [Microbacterium sp. 77mftsu3.1]